MHRLVSENIESADGITISYQSQVLEGATTQIVCFDAFNASKDKLSKLVEQLMGERSDYGLVSVNSCRLNSQLPATAKQSLEWLYDDFDILLAHMQDRSPEVAIIFLASGYSGPLVLSYMMSRQLRLAGLILVNLPSRLTLPKWFLFLYDGFSFLMKGQKVNSWIDRFKLDSSLMQLNLNSLASFYALYEALEIVWQKDVLEVHAPLFYIHQKSSLLSSHDRKAWLSRFVYFDTSYVECDKGYDWLAKAINEWVQLQTNNFCSGRKALHQDDEDDSI